MNPDNISKGKETKDNVFGVVVECGFLNVRKEPISSSEILCIIPLSATVLIEESASTDDFYKICTEFGLEGFCKKEYIKI